MTTYTTLIGTTADTTGDKLTAFMRSLQPKPYKVLVPKGTYKIDVNFYSAIDNLNGYVARVRGAPSMDYSGMYGLSDDQWNGCAWQRDAKGTLEAARNMDWQVRNAGGHGTVIQQVYIDGMDTDEWLYLLPVVGRGAIKEIEILLQILKAKFDGWHPERAVVNNYPSGGKFYTGASGSTHDPVPIPPVPNPFPPWPTPLPVPEVPVVELMDNLDIVIQECSYKGETVKGPWTLQYRNGSWWLVE